MIVTLAAVTPLVAINGVITLSTKVLNGGCACLTGAGAELLPPPQAGSIVSSANAVIDSEREVKDVE